MPLQGMFQRDQPIPRALPGAVLRTPYGRQEQTLNFIDVLSQCDGAFFAAPFTGRATKRMSHLWFVARWSQNICLKNDNRPFTADTVNGRIWSSHLRCDWSITPLRTLLETDSFQLPLTMYGGSSTIALP